MGTPISVIGTVSLGTCGKPPIPAASSNVGNVLAGGRPVVTTTSYWGFHCSDDDCHAEFASQGSPSVKASGMSVMRQGSGLTFGDTAGVGFPSVLVA